MNLMIFITVILMSLIVICFTFRQAIRELRELKRRELVDGDDEYIERIQFDIYDSRECDDEHLSNDCPLCGAK